MERKNQIILAGFLTLGLAGCTREIKPTPKWQFPTLEKTGTSSPLPSFSNSQEDSEFVIPTSSPTVVATQTPIFTSSPTPEATPEILKCVFPLKEFTIISSFLEKRLSRGEVTLHLGMDFIAKPGDKSKDKRDILSPCKGTLIYAGYTTGNPTDGLGNVVVIQYDWNGEPIYAIFAHLEKTIEGKKEGDTISTGEVIGEMGHSGTRPDNVHLHLQVWNKTGWEQIVVGTNRQRLKKYGWPYATAIYPHWDKKETVEKYLDNPYTWLQNVTGQEVK